MPKRVVVTVLLTIILIIAFSLPYQMHYQADLPTPGNDYEEVSVSSIVTPSPVLTETPMPTPIPTAESTPKPKPTEVPFSQLAPTTLMSFEELVGDNGDYGEIPPPPPKDTYKIVVNIKYQFITIYKKNDKGEFNVPSRYMICTTGKDSTPTPLGEFEIGEDKARFAQFLGYNSWAQYWTQLVDDYYFHSLLYSKKDASSYTSSYAKLGTPVSHGCIRLLVPDARWIYYNIAPGTKAEIIEGEENEEAARIRSLLVFPPLPKHRIKLVPGEIPVTESWPGYQP